MMAKTHWKQLVNTDYLGAYALKDGEDTVLTINTVVQEMVTGTGGKKETCTVAHFAENNVKPMILNRTNMKMITKLYKSPYIEDWSGKRIQIFQDTTKLAGETVECLRIRPFIPRATAQDMTPRCAVCRAELTGYKQMNALQLADYTMRKYGKAMCGKCAQAAATLPEPTAPEGGAPDAE
jgi:hypothetical protein